MFEIICNTTGDWCIAPDEVGALQAVRTFIREAATHGSTCSVYNLETETLVWKGHRVDRPSL